MALLGPATAWSQDGGPSIFAPPTEEAPPTPSEEEVTAQVETLSEQGSEMFHQGRYREAISIFEEAYNLAQVANLLYNIGLSHERLGEPDKAIVYYERFIIAKDADPDVRARALERVRELEQIQREKDKQNGGDITVTPPNGAGDGNTVITPPQNNPEQDGLGSLGVTGIIVGTAGVLAAGTGVLFGVLAQSEQDSFDQSRDLYTKQVARTNAENRALTADILYGLGGVAILAGVTMFVLDWTVFSEPVSEDSTGQSLKIRPDLGPGGVGATVEWTFGGL